MAEYGLLIDFEYCTGCQACEVACKEEHGFPVGKWGIRVLQDGPWEIEPKKWNWNKLPIPTDLCDLCADRVEAGRVPTCVHHCLASVMKFDTVMNLAQDLSENPGQYLFVPKKNGKRSIRIEQPVYTPEEKAAAEAEVFETCTHADEVRKAARKAKEAAADAPARTAYGWNADKMDM